MPNYPIRIGLLGGPTQRAVRSLLDNETENLKESSHINHIFVGIEDRGEAPIQAQVPDGRKA